MKQLRKLEEWNAEAGRRYDEDGSPRLNGIACPRCDAELFDLYPGETLMSYPPQRVIGCGACGWQGYRVA